jgi:hypothetical protein
MPRWMEPVITHLHLEASPAAEEAAPEPALTGASGGGDTSGASHHASDVLAAAGHHARQRPLDLVLGAQACRSQR